MTSDPVQAIARAILYEGYLLWPYRASALKNQQRFTFGGVHPPAFAAHCGDRCRLVMECLAEGPAEARVELGLRFLHLVDRRPARRATEGLATVDELTVAGERHVAFEEAAEREVRLGPASLRELTGGCSVAVARPGGEDVEDLGEEAVLVRRWAPLQGALELRARPLRKGLHRVSVRFANRSASPARERRDALRRTFLSTHLVVRAHGAQLVSQTDPPQALRAEAEACRNDGVWPVLVGEEGDRHTLLGAPIILSDYPAVAPESPGDLFDGGEIDALLIHSIRSLTEAEHEEMRATDPRVREILDRSLALEPERMLALYGAVREMRPLEP